MPTFSGFTNVTGVSVSTLVPSNIVEVQDVNYPVDVTITGDGDPQFRTCDDSSCNTEIRGWQSYAGNIMHDDYLQLRLTSPGFGTSTNSATVTIGDYAEDWTVTTEFVPPTPLSEDFDGGFIDTSFVTTIFNLSLSPATAHTAPYSLLDTADLVFLPSFGYIIIEIGTNHSGGTVEAAYLSSASVGVYDDDTGTELATYPGGGSWQTFSLSVGSGVSTIAIEVSEIIGNYGIDSVSFTPD